VAITLGGLSLSPHMIWSDALNYQPVVQSTARTLGGAAVITSSATTKGRRITLDAVSDQGWLTKAQVDELITLASVAGSTYPLDIHGSTHTVMFFHSEGSAVVASPILSKQVYLSTDYYTGSIKLITV